MSIIKAQFVSVLPLSLALKDLQFFETDFIFYNNKLLTHPLVNFYN